MAIGYCLLPLADAPCFYSLLPIRYSLLPIPYCLLLVRRITPPL